MFTDFYYGSSRACCCPAVPSRARSRARARAVPCRATTGGRSQQESRRRVNVDEEVNQCVSHPLQSEEVPSPDSGPCSDFSALLSDSRSPPALLRAHWSAPPSGWWPQLATWLKWCSAAPWGPCSLLRRRLCSQLLKVSCVTEFLWWEVKRLRFDFVRRLRLVSMQIETTSMKMSGCSSEASAVFTREQWWRWDEYTCSS